MKDAFYFSHDSNARNDEKIIQLRLELGWAGYGIYWALIEMLRDANEYKMQTNYKRIAFALQDDENRIRRVVECFNLFEISSEFFWSNSLKKRMKKREEKSIKAKQAAETRWGNANVMQTHSKRNAIKEKKVNKIKRKEIKENAGSIYNDFSFCENGFMEVWQEFMKHRKVLKKPLTEYGEKIALQKVQEYSKGDKELAIKLVNQAIEKGWQGIFPLTEENKPKKKIIV